MTTWTSLRRPSTNVGRSGRSISRHVRIASVDGRPSRRKKEPGIRPAAYIRSSTSTVRGKKSNWSLGCLDTVVADSSIVSSSRYAMTDPAAWRANRPVSKRTVRVPKVPLSRIAVVSCTVSVESGEVVKASVNSSPPRNADRSGTTGTGARTRPVFDRSTREHHSAPGSHYRGPANDAPEDGWRGGSCGDVWLSFSSLGQPSWVGQPGSAAQAEALDQRPVAPDVDLGEVVQQVAAAADHQEQAAPGVVIMLMLLEVLGEVDDPLGQQGHLRLWGTGISPTQPILGQDLALLCGGQCHRSIFSCHLRTVRAPGIA